MRNKDTIVLESLYQMISEGAGDVRKWIVDKLLKAQENFPEIRDLESDEDKVKKATEIADAFITADETPSKAEAQVIGKYYVEAAGLVSVEAILEEYAKLKEIRTDIRYKELDRYYRPDGSTGHLKKFRVESKDLQKFKTYQDFTNFIHTAEGILQAAIEAKENWNKQEEEKTQGERQEVAAGSIFNDDKVTIWAIKNQNESVDYGHILTNQYIGGESNWCITYGKYDPYKNSSNWYPRYRYESEWSFYFIVDHTRPDTDKRMKLVAVHAQADGKYGYTPCPNGTVSGLTWDKLIQTIPVLADKKDIIVYVKPTDEELKAKVYEQISSRRDARKFGELEEHQKSEYILLDFDVTKEMVEKILDSKKLLNDYINRKAQSMAIDFSRGDIPSDIRRILFTPERAQLKERFENECIRYMEMHYNRDENGNVVIGL